MTPFIYLRLSRTDTEIYFTHFYDTDTPIFWAGFHPKPTRPYFLSFFGPNIPTAHKTLTIFFFLFVWAEQLQAHMVAILFLSFFLISPWCYTKPTKPKHLHTPLKLLLFLFLVPYYLDNMHTTPLTLHLGKPQVTTQAVNPMDQSFIRQDGLSTYGSYVPWFPNMVTTQGLILFIYFLQPKLRIKLINNAPSFANDDLTTHSNSRQDCRSLTRPLGLC